MDQESLKVLLANIPRKKISAKLRNLMPEIDRQIRDGIRHEDIIEVLNANGFNLNVNTFRTNLYKYRKSLRLNNVESKSKASGNSPIDAPGSNNVTSTSQSSWDDMLDPKKRGEFGDQYLNRKPPLFKRSKTNEGSCD